MELTADMINLTSEIIPEKIEGSIGKAFTILRKQLIQEVDNHCAMCRRVYSSPNLRVHHIDGCALNWARHNLLIACKTCHHKVHGHFIRPEHKAFTADELRQSYLDAHPRENSESKTVRFEKWRKALEEVTPRKGRKPPTRAIIDRRGRYHKQRSGTVI